eukprot:scaffold122577_cov63-Phaeocystis_antarctica.AAC.1
MRVRSASPIISYACAHTASHSSTLTVPVPRSLPAPQVPAAHLRRIGRAHQDGEAPTCGAQELQVMSALVWGCPKPVRWPTVDAAGVGAHGRRALSCPPPRPTVKAARLSAWAALGGSGRLGASSPRGGAGSATASARRPPLVVDPLPRLGPGPRARGGGHARLGGGRWQSRPTTLSQGPCRGKAAAPEEGAGGRAVAAARASRRAAATAEENCCHGAPPSAAATPRRVHWHPPRGRKPL